MAGEYKSPCGCVIHIAQRTAKRKVVSQQSCPLHKHANDLQEALFLLLSMIEIEALIPDSVSYMKKAREALAKSGRHL